MRPAGLTAAVLLALVLRTQVAAGLLDALAGAGLSLCNRCGLDRRVPSVRQSSAKVANATIRPERRATCLRCVVRNVQNSGQ